MNDLTTLAYELGDLMDSMPEFDADSIYYTWDSWENKDGDVAELRFNLKTGKWSSNEIFKEFFKITKLKIYLVKIRRKQRVMENVLKN